MLSCKQGQAHTGPGRRLVHPLSCYLFGSELARTTTQSWFLCHTDSIIMPVAGINLQKVENVSMSNCTVHSTGCRGITVTAGDTLSLRSGDSSFVNNHIHHVAQWKRTYQAAIEFQTMGCDFINNTIRVSPHNCVDGAVRQ